MKTKLGLCGCRCDGTPCEPASICFDFDGCFGIQNFLSVTLVDGDDVSHTGTTDFDGIVCFTDLPSGHWTASAAPTDCDAVSLSGTLACGDVANISHRIVCGSSNYCEFWVYGCGSLPLPGATCTLGGTDSGSAVTDGDGYARIAMDHTGTHTYSITHPSGRFDDVSGSFNRRTLCAGEQFTFGLAPKTGYVCCQFLVDLGEPIPMKDVLTLTDAGGTIPMNMATCGDIVCVMRTMDNVSTNVGGTVNLPKCACTGGGNMDMPPTDIGTAECELLWELSLRSTGFITKQAYHTINPNLVYPPACPAGCGDSGSWNRITWRVHRADCPTFNTAFPAQTATESSYVVNSTYPISITCTYAAGNGFGPVPATSPGLTGNPYSLSATIAE